MASPLLHRRAAQALVFATSFCVLVLEILAGRLLAPFIGVSLETFTGIIGTVLAGIALGAAVGGRLADRGDAARLVGPTVALGGALTWLAPVAATVAGPSAGGDPGSIVLLTVFTFLSPATVLSAVTPMVVKLQVNDLGSTGAVVGSLSAAGTAGALAGTFVTGFVLVATFPTRAVIVAVGVFLVATGAVLSGWARIAANRAVAVAVVAVGTLAVTLQGPCQWETPYACVQIVVDPERPSGRSLVLNGDRNSYVDLADPAYLDFRYMRIFADITAVQPPGPVRALHIGGAGFTFPRYLEAVRPGSDSLVLEIDAELVDLARRQLGLTLSDRLRVTTGDARLSVAAVPDDSVDLVFGDAFSGLTVPWHLTTTEFVAELDRVLAPGGIVALNLIDGGDLAFVAAELATYARHFEHLALVSPPEGPSQQVRNYVLVAADEPLTALEIGAADGRLANQIELLGLLDGADLLKDDRAPVDQLRQAP